MYKNKTIIQIGSHEGNTYNDPIFNIVDDTNMIILVEPVPFLFNKLRFLFRHKFYRYLRTSIIFPKKISFSCILPS